MEISDHERAELTELEEAMWRAETRYDPVFQSNRFATDFVEFGRSGRVYTRSQTIQADPAPGPIYAQLPLDQLHMRCLAPGTVLITYNSHVQMGSTVAHARRSSIWSRCNGQWVMRFHQGTPYTH
jgi:hypothetical protein